MEEILTISEEEKVNIRQKLRKSINNLPNSTKHKEDYSSEIHNTLEVPFEGSIYNNLDTRISSDDINKMYNKYTPSLLSIVFQSIMAPAYKIFR